MSDEMITQAEREAMRGASMLSMPYSPGLAGDVLRLLNALEAAEKRVADETQAAIEAEARAGQIACNLAAMEARLKPLVDAAEEYKQIGYMMHEEILKIVQRILRPTLATAVCALLRAVHHRG